jgi:hypothetical protein
MVQHKKMSPTQKSIWVRTQADLTLCGLNRKINQSMHAHSLIPKLGAQIVTNQLYQFLNFACL